MNQLTFSDMTLTTAAISTGKPAYDAILARIALPLNYQAVKHHLETLTAKPSTIALHKAAIKAAVVSAITDRRELAAVDSAFKSIKVARPEKAIHAEKVIPAEKMNDIIEGASDRRRVAMRFLLTTGCRISEMAALRLADCTTAGDITYCHVIGKGKKARRVMITTALYREIKTIYQGRTYLFENTHGKHITRIYFLRAMNAEGEKHGIHLHPHMFRHTFITSKLKAGKTLKAVSTYAGHAQCATTAEMYLHDELTAEDLLT